MPDFDLTAQGFRLPHFFTKRRRTRFPTVDAVLWKTLCLPSAIVGDVILLPGGIVIYGSAALFFTLMIKGLSEAGGL